MHGRELEAKNRAKEDEAALGGDKKDEESKTGDAAAVNQDVEMAEENKNEEN